MKPIQAEIVVDRGIIRRIKKTPGKVVIISDNTVVEFPNAWIYPGFVDSHGHMLGLGQKLSSLNFESCKSSKDCVQKALNYKEYRSGWVLGRGWNQENWVDKTYPTKEMLDEVFPDLPVSLVRIDGHAAWVNSKALYLANIDKNTPNPQGGAIIRDAVGNPSGILIDNAMNLISKFIPTKSEIEIEELILKADTELLQCGITEVHDMDVRPGLLPVFNKLDEAEKLGVKIQSYVQGQENEWLGEKVEVSYGKKHNIIGVKFYADGALGSSGAALLEPYSDEPENSGLLLLSEAELIDKAGKAIDAGFDIAVHAIGDAANRLVLNAFKKLKETGRATRDTILRIEHAQMVHPMDVKIFSEQQIFAAIQPIHCLSDAVMARKRTGGRIDYSYPWQTLLSSGAIIAGGSDFPIESHNPLMGIDAFVNRIPFGEKTTWVGSERLNVEDALAAYTINAHQLSGNEQVRGKIEVGREADFTLLDKDITKVDKSEILEARVLATIINGQIKYIKE